VSEPAVSLAFFDPESELHGTMRAGAAVLFERDTARALDGAPRLDRTVDGFHARHGDGVELTFTPVSAPIELAGAAIRVARVSGTVEGRPIDCLGTASETFQPPLWAELDALRTISAIFDEEHAVLAVALRPRGAAGHGQEEVSAHLLSGEESATPNDARVSTVYDGEGRQRAAGLELWVGEEDFPRRLSGTVRAGMTLALEGLRVNLAVFEWQMEGREGVGAYEITVRDEPIEPAAAA
jgi:hypothetical protein